ncbi:MAG: hypothetical protein AAGA38_06670 [Pseudomonadota bacterium]
MRYVSALICICACSLQSHAATTLRSGEHADFSRVVVELEQPGDWSLTRSSIGYIFSADTLRPPVQTDDVFTYIPKTRLGSVRYDERRNIIIFGLTCELCSADAFEIRNGRVVIDFKNEITRSSDNKISDRLENNTANYSYIDSRDIRSKDTLSKHEIIPHDAFVSEKSFIILTSPFRVENTTEISDQNKELEKEIFEAVIGNETSEKQTIENPSVSNSPTGHISEDFADKIEKMVVVSPLDMDPAQYAETSAPDSPEYACFDVKAGAILSLSASYNDLAAAYSDIFDAKDNVRVQELERLVKAQLALGLGQEALSSLRLYPKIDRSTHFLGILAQILAGQELTEMQRTSLKSCDDSETLWRVLAFKVADTPVLEDVDSIVLQYLELPYALRRTIAPRFIERLMRTGNERAAYRVAENIRSVDQTVFDELAETKIPSSSIVSLGIDEISEEVAASNGPNNGTVNGLIRKMQRALKDDYEIKTEDWVLIDSAIYQYRSDWRGKDLLTLKVKLSLAQGDLGATGGSLRALLDGTSEIQEELLLELFEVTEKRSSKFADLYLRSFLNSWAGEVRYHKNPGNKTSAIGRWLKEHTTEDRLIHPQNTPSRETESVERGKFSALDQADRIDAILSLLDTDQKS